MGQDAWRVRLVVHPFTIASVCLLVVNDHLVKQRWPGVVSGKLSDVAGVWMVGALVVAALGSVRWGTACTAVAFATLKTSASVAVLAAPILGGVTRRDPTDLVALVVLWPLGRVALRCGARRTRRANDAWSTVAAVFVALSAVLATSATSCEAAAEVSEVVLAADGSVLALYSAYGSLSVGEWYVVTPDGATPRPDAQPVMASSQHACVADMCFRVVPDEGVYTHDMLLYEYTVEQADAVRAHSVCFQVPAFSSIVAVDGPDGVDLWVAAGVSGVVHPDPDGVLTEVPVGDARPPGSQPQREESRAILWVVPVLIAIGAGILLLLLARRLTVSQRLVVAAAAVSVNLAWAAVSAAWLTDLEIDGPPMTTLLVFGMYWVVPLGLAQLVWFLPLLKWSRRPIVPFPPPYWPGPN
ncbi:MAG: hypothetical protein Q8M22_07695 [Actinomycetota bacterium]|nr:hypothetical protein [Actinomycetota bacterium]